MHMSIGYLEPLVCISQVMRAIEEYLSQMCHDRSEPTQEECEEAADTDLLPPYKPENGQGARVTMSSSVSLLSR